MAKNDDLHSKIKMREMNSAIIKNKKRSLEVRSLREW